MDDDESKLVSLLRKERTMPLFSDVEVTAALNSCLDMAKWNALPEPVKDRIKCLFKHHRLKMVCFSNELGFGLRVFVDNSNFTIRPDGGDEAEVTQACEGARLDLEGHWVRCPADLFKIKKEYIITDKRARYFYDGVDDWDGEVDDDHNQESVWSNRSSATKFTDKEKAEALAAKIDGIVVDY